MTGNPSLRPPAWPDATDPPPADALVTLRRFGMVDRGGIAPVRMALLLLHPRPRPIAELLIVATDGDPNVGSC